MNLRQIHAKKNVIMILLKIEAKQETKPSSRASKPSMSERFKIYRTQDAAIHKITMLTVSILKSIDPKVEVVCSKFINIEQDISYR